MRSFKQYLSEMPYIQVGDQIVDLELEKIRTKKQFITYMKFFFSLNRNTPLDKYRSQIKFKSKSEREKIKKAIINNGQVDMFLRTIKMTRDEFMQLMKEL